MKRQRPTHLLFFLLAFIFSLPVGCGAQGRMVAIGEPFKLEKEEKVAVKDTNLTIQLKSVRRTWHVDGKRETADADIIITLDGKEQRQWMDIGEKLTVGEYVVKLQAADPFGKTNCKLIVERR